MKKASAILALVLSLAMILSLAVMPTGAAGEVSKYDGTASTKLDTDASGAYLIQSAADLAYYVKEVNSGSGKFNGKTIKLTTDIVWNEGDASTWTKETTGLNSWTPIGVWGNTSMFNATFDGQGHTVSGLFAAPTTNNFGFFGVSWGATVKNLKIDNSKFFFSQNQSGGLIGIHRSSYLNVENVYVDIDIEATNTNVGGLVGYLHGNGNTSLEHQISFKNSVYAGTLNSTNTYVGGFIGGITPHVNNVALKWTIGIEDCMVNGSITGKAAVGNYIGAHSGYPSGVTPTAPSIKLTVKNAMALAPVAIATGGWNNHGAFAGGLTYLDAASSATNVWFVDSLNTNTAYKNVVKFDGTDLSSQFASTEKTVDEINAMATEDLAAAGFENWGATAKGVMPKTVAALLGEKVVAPFVGSTWDGTSVSTELKTDDSGAYLIQSAADLAFFAKSVGDGTSYSKKVVKLTTDIRWNKGDSSTWTKDSTGLNAWTPIGNWSKNFQGTFDGQGHTITGLWASLAGENLGVFSTAGSGAVIKNLSITNSVLFCAKDTVANKAGNIGLVGVCNWGNITFENLYIDLDLDSKDAWYVGGLLGKMHGSNTSGTMTVKNCVYAGTITSNSNYCAGFIGGVQPQATVKKIEITDSLFAGKITTTGGGCGGMVATNVSTNSTPSTFNIAINDSMSLGSVTSGYNSGAITGPINATYTGTSGTNIWFLKDSSNKTNGVFPGEVVKTAAEIEALTTEALAAAGFENWVATEEGVMPKTVAVMRGLYEEQNNDDTSSDSSSDSSSDTSSDSDKTDTAVVVKPNIKPAANASVYDGTKSTKLRTEGNKVYIDSAADLAYFADFITSGKPGCAYGGKTVILTTDIIWNTGDAADWIETAPKYTWSAAAWNKFFWGTFDGQGHVISGLYQSSEKDNIGFFNGMGGTTGGIKNLAIVNSAFICTRASGSANLGGLVGVMGEGCKITIDNVYVDAILHAPNAYQVGGLVGRVHNGLCALDITNAVFAGTATGSHMVGGFVGNADVNNNKAGTSSTINVTDAIMMGTVKGGAQTSGAVGRNQKGDTVLTNVIVAGKVESNDNAAFLGEGEIDVTMANCFYAEEAAKVASAKGATAGAKAVKAEALLGAKALETTKYANWTALDNAYPLPTSVAQMLKLASNPPTADYVPVAFTVLAFVAMASAAAIFLRKKAI